MIKRLVERIKDIIFGEGRMLSNKIVARNRQIFQNSSKHSVPELAKQYGLKEDTVARIVAHHKQWGAFA